MDHSRVSAVLYNIFYIFSHTSDFTFEASSTKTLINPPSSYNSKFMFLELYHFCLSYLIILYSSTSSDLVNIILTHYSFCDSFCLALRRICMRKLVRMKIDALNRSHGFSGKQQPARNARNDAFDSR